MSDSYSFADSPEMAMPATTGGSQSSASSPETAVIISETKVIHLTGDGEHAAQDPRVPPTGASGSSPRRDVVAPHDAPGGGGSQGPREVPPSSGPSSASPPSASSTRETDAEAAVGAAAGTGRGRVDRARTLGQGGGGISSSCGNERRGRRHLTPALETRAAIRDRDTAAPHGVSGSGGLPTSPSVISVGSSASLQTAISDVHGVKQVAPASTTTFADLASTH